MPQNNQKNAESKPQTRFQSFLSSVKDLGYVAAIESRDAIAEGIDVTCMKVSEFSENHIRPTDKQLETSESIRLGWKVKKATLQTAK